MKKLPRVSVHEVPPFVAPDLSKLKVSLPRSPLPPGVKPIYSVELGPEGNVKRGSKRVRVQG